MSRRRAAQKRTILPDHKFKDVILARFMNRIMLDGKKTKAEKILYKEFGLSGKTLELYSERDQNFLLKEKGLTINGAKKILRVNQIYYSYKL